MSQGLVPASWSWEEPRPTTGKEIRISVLQAQRTNLCQKTEELRSEFFPRDGRNSALPASWSWPCEHQAEEPANPSRLRPTELRINDLGAVFSPSICGNLLHHQQETNPVRIFPHGTELWDTRNASNVIRRKRLWVWDSTPSLSNGEMFQLNTCTPESLPSTYPTWEIICSFTQEEQKSNARERVSRISGLAVEWNKA